MCVDIENLSIPFLTNCMLSCSGVHGGRRSWGDKTVRSSACQDDCRVTGHVGIWIVEGEQLQAVMSSAAAELCLWVDDGGLLTVFFFFITPPAHKIFIILAHAVWRGPSGWSGCKSSKRVRTEAYPLRRGTRCKLKLTQSERSIRSLHDLVLVSTSDVLLVLQYKINTALVLFYWYLSWYKTVTRIKPVILCFSLLIMTIIIVIHMEICEPVCASSSFLFSGNAKTKAEKMVCFKRLNRQSTHLAFLSFCKLLQG